MSDTTNLSDAIRVLQESQAKFVEAIEQLETHNNDLEAHPQLRDMIDQITGESDAIYTDAQIRQMIKEGIEAHTSLDFKTAHSGWESWEDELNKRLSEMVLRIETVEKRLDGATDDDMTDLDAILQSIEDKYAGPIDHLYQAFVQAQEQGQTDLANSYKKAYEETITQMRDEKLAAMDKWQQEHGAGAPTATILIGFDPNGGTGSIDAVSVIKGEDYVLPNCPFTPPRNATFIRWSSSADGAGELNGSPGNVIQTTKEMPDTLTFYAIWSTTGIGG